jgi:hypothetical protein
MEKIYAEVGFGNDTFFSTEIENEGKEYRVPGFIKPKRISGYYLRLWIFKSIIILSTNPGLEIVKKDKNRLKILFGMSGTN